MPAAEFALRQHLHTLYTDHHGWLYAWLRKKLGCSHNAADVAQDTFVRIIGSRDALLGVQEPRAYLTTTAKRLLVDRARRQLIEQSYLAELALSADALHAHPSAEQVLATLQALEQISTALAAVSAKAREAFLRHYLDGETHAAIAGALGVSTRMVQKYLVQALLQCPAGRGLPMSDTPAIAADATVAEQAAEWIVRLTADDESERAQARAGFEAWKQRDPRHAKEAEQLEGFLGQVQSVREASAHKLQPARAALDASFSAGRKRGRAKGIGAAFVIAMALALPAWFALQAWPVAYLAADLRTPTGQWQTQTLADGTRITLNSASAVNLRYDARRRVVALVKGEILVDVAKDATRPFQVDTPDGSIRALGTRFVVRRVDDVSGHATDLTMIESSVSVQTAAQRATHAAESITISAGQRVRITAAGVSEIETVDARSVSDGWQFRKLVVENQPLPDVLEALNRQRPGFIRFDRARLEAIKVSAVLPLDDTDRALRLLAASFPNLEVRTITTYLVLVDAPPAR